jgi:peptidyl-prolyl cis-trans isomerase SDCCAG10
MANNGKRNTNNSQWFITLDKTEELSGKHTLFGRIQGPTYYSAYRPLITQHSKLTIRRVERW